MPLIQRRLLVGRQEEADEHERLEPGDVGVEPVVDRELEGYDERGREGCESAQRLLARHEGDEYGEEDRERHHRPLQERKLGDLAEHRPRADPVALEGEGLVVEEPHRLDGVPVEQDDPEREQPDANPAEYEIHYGLALAPFVGDPERTEDERIELDGEPGRDAAPPRYRRGRHREPHGRDRGDDDVVGVVVGRIDGVGEGGPGEDKGGGPLLAGEPVAQDKQCYRPRDEAEQREGVGRWEEAPLSGEAEHEDERHIEQVVERAVGVSRADVRGHGAVGYGAVQNAVGADDPGVADVYYAGVDVEAEDEAPRKTGEHHQEPHRQVGRLLDLLAYPEPHEKGPDEQVDEWRVPQYDGLLDYPFPEEAVRDQEPEQRHDVQVAHGEQSVRAPESGCEGERERQPDPPVVGLLAVGAAHAAGQVPPDLIPRVHVVEDPGPIVHPDGGDLLALLRRPASDRPALVDVETDGPRAILIVGFRVVRAVAGELLPYLGARGGEFDRLLFREPGVFDLIRPRRDVDSAHVPGIIGDLETGDLLPRTLLYKNYPPQILASVVVRRGLDGRLGIVLF